jgi:hypothetical protein
MYELVQKSHKKCTNWYKRHNMYEFVIVNLYKKISKKKSIRVGISTRDQYGLQSSQRHISLHISLQSNFTPPPPLVPILFIYRKIRTPSEKWDCTNSFVQLIQPLYYHTMVLGYPVIRGISPFFYRGQLIVLGTVAGAGGWPIEQKESSHKRKKRQTQ